MKKLRYCIQKHFATHLHYDLRLELDGVAKSWAIPKGPSTEEGVKRLAVQVEDHSIEYMDFEGEIEEGSYGAGKVELWDRGYWEQENVKADKIVAIIHGEKLKGRFTILRFKDKNWLFFKSKDK
ncbi:MAG: ATP-dependent DNA ligase [Candidatus Aenigmarchaeota archaeon]|nr:ATP-dependent DNA ligase [Candidatus Aenigmarchaeota archaeon]